MQETGEIELRLPRSREGLTGMHVIRLRTASLKACRYFTCQKSNLLYHALLAPRNNSNGIIEASRRKRLRAMQRRSLYLNHYGILCRDSLATTKLDTALRRVPCVQPACITASKKYNATGSSIGRSDSSYTLLNNAPY